MGLVRRLRGWLAANRAIRDPLRYPLNLGSELAGLQRFQAERLAASFADLRDHPKTQAAAEFFLADLYGDRDVTARDRGVERVMPLMQRLLPAPLLATAASAFKLAVLSHALDLAMVAAHRAQGGGPWTVASYGHAWRAVGRRRIREHQVRLIVRIGRELDVAAQTAWIPRLLRASRLPARLAGLAELQGFLERGFAAFQALDGADRFLDSIAERELEVSDRLFAAHPAPFAGAAGRRAGSA